MLLTCCVNKLAALPRTAGIPELTWMALYLTFPVTMFWIANQPQYFEEYIVKRKREIFPPVDIEGKMLLEEAKKEARRKRESMYMQD
ncbi:protein PET100 homolog, mitochondrial [Hyperolius riggenbachi]|uniref:protein PET100 homolog, mitochondrial n=1 Tax=Hyperolius riggenbachi TaxID=752182 RepID=UPI0035A30B40